MKKNKLQIPQTYLYCLLLGLLAVINLYGLIILKKTQQEVTLLNQKLTQQQQYQGLNLNADFLPDLQKLNQVFPNEPGIINFITTLNRHGADSLNFNLNFENDEPLTDTSVNSLPLIIEISGTSNQISNFYSKLTQIPYLIETRSLNLQKAPGTPDQINLLMKGRLYVANPFH